MTQYFNVAGHGFSLTLPAKSALWATLDNYAPFRTEVAETVFALTLEEGFPAVAGNDEKDAGNQDWEPVLVSNEKPGEPRLDLYRRAGQWMFEMAPVSGMPVCGRLVCDAGFREGRLQELEEGRHGRFCIDNALMLMYAFRTAGLGTLEMHSSVTVRDGEAYLFLGNSGAGKSTHSRLWRDHLPGSTLLNDDNPVVRVLPDGEVRVYGTPWSGKTPCYRNASAPVAAMVRIVQAPENRLIRCSLVEAYAQLYSSSSGLKGEDGLADAFHQTLTGVLRRVPGYVLRCRADREAALVCSEGIRRDREKEEG